jgi:hypothetical protein
MMISPGVVESEGVVWANAAPLMSITAPNERLTPLTVRAFKPNPNCRSDMVLNLDSVDELIILLFSRLPFYSSVPALRK